MTYNDGKASALVVYGVKHADALSRAIQRGEISPTVENARRLQQQMPTPLGEGRLQSFIAAHQAPSGPNRDVVRRVRDQLRANKTVPAHEKRQERIQDLGFTARIRELDGLASVSDAPSHYHADRVVAKNSAGGRELVSIQNERINVRGNRPGYITRPELEHEVTERKLLHSALLGKKLTPWGGHLGADPRVADHAAAAQTAKGWAAAQAAGRAAGASPLDGFFNTAYKAVGGTQGAPVAVDSRRSRAIDRRYDKMLRQFADNKHTVMALRRSPDLTTGVPLTPGAAAFHNAFRPQNSAARVQVARVKGASIPFALSDELALAGVKHADHVQDRRAERTPSIPAPVIETLRSDALKVDHPAEGNHYTPLKDAHGNLIGYAVFRTIGGKLRLMTILSKEMTPKGSSLGHVLQAKTAGRVDPRALAAFGQQLQPGDVVQFQTHAGDVAQQSLRKGLMHGAISTPIQKLTGSPQHHTALFAGVDPETGRLKIIHNYEQGNKTKIVQDYLDNYAHQTSFHAYRPKGLTPEMGAAAAARAAELAAGPSSYAKNNLLAAGVRALGEKAPVAPVKPLASSVAARMATHCDPTTGICSALPVDAYTPVVGREKAVEMMVGRSVPKQLEAIAATPASISSSPHMSAVGQYHPADQVGVARGIAQRILNKGGTAATTALARLRLR